MHVVGLLVVSKSIGSAQTCMKSAPLVESPQTPSGHAINAHQVRLPTHTPRKPTHTALGHVNFSRGGFIANISLHFVVAIGNFPAKTLL